MTTFSTDAALYIFTSLTAGSSHIVTATSRLETILRANRVPFKAIDIATDDKARMLWGRRAGKDSTGRVRKLPGLVQEGLVLGDLVEIEEWNEYGELKQHVKIYYDEYTIPNIHNKPPELLKPRKKPAGTAKAAAAAKAAASTASSSVASEKANSSTAASPAAPAAPPPPEEKAAKPETPGTSGEKPRETTIQTTLPLRSVADEAAQKAKEMRLKSLREKVHGKKPQPGHESVTGHSGLQSPTSGAWVSGLAETVQSPISGLWPPEVPTTGVASHEPADVTKASDVAPTKEKSGTNAEAQESDAPKAKTTGEEIKSPPPTAQEAVKEDTKVETTSSAQKETKEPSEAETPSTAQEALKKDTKVETTSSAQEETKEPAKAKTPSTAQEAEKKEPKAEMTSTAQEAEKKEPKAETTSTAQEETKEPLKVETPPTAPEVQETKKAETQPTTEGSKEDQSVAAADASKEDAGR